MTKLLRNDDGTVKKECDILIDKEDGTKVWISEEFTKNRMYWTGVLDKDGTMTDEERNEFLELFAPIFETEIIN